MRQCAQHAPVVGLDALRHALGVDPRAIDRAGNTARINLPEMREAYLMSDAIAEYDGA